MRNDLSSSPLLGKAVRAAILGTALGLGAVPVIALADSPETSVRQFNVPAGSLDQVLNQYAREAGITLSSTPQITQGLSSPGLQGSYSADQGLRLLLNGTGLEAVSKDGISFVLRPLPDDAALALPSTDVRGLALGNALGSMEGYNATHSQVATKTSTSLAETSQSVSVVTRQQMDDQG